MSSEPPASSSPSAVAPASCGRPHAAAWFEMAVSDMPRARAFYETILAVKLVALPNPEWEMFMFPCDEPQGVSGALVRMPNCQPGVGGTTVYLNVEGQLDAVLARIPAAGGKVVVPRTDISPHGFIGLLEDSEGNVVGLHSRV